MRGRGVLAGLALVALVPLTLLPASGSSPDGSIEVSTATPRADQAFRVTGDGPGSRRTAYLQVAPATGGSWHRRAVATTGRAGGFRFSWSSRVPQRLRVVLPRTPRTADGAGEPRWTSRVVRVTPRAAKAESTATPAPATPTTPVSAATPTLPAATPTGPPAPVAQVVTLAAPAYALEQSRATMTASVVPAVAGRGLVLQRRQPDATWSAVASAVTATDGTATFEVTTGAVDHRTYRVVAESAADVLEGTSDPVPLPVLAGLPRVDITTDDGIAIGAAVDRDADGDTDDDDKFAYTHGTVELDPRGSGLPAFDQPTRFRVRGNSTAWALVKLSYKIKLDAKARLLPSSTSKNWALLANFYDRSLLRNQVAFEAGRRLGLAWTPHVVSVELWQNGFYAGVYQLAETVESGSRRLDIDTDGDDSAGSKATNGGYLLEADHWPDTDPRLTTGKGAQVFLKEPEFEAIDPAPYVAGVKSYLDAFETALYSSGFTDPATGYRAFVDVPSFVNWYLLNEVMKNLDSGYDASCWMYRDKDGRLSMGPAWDFDQSSGSRSAGGLGDPTGWFLNKLPQASPVTGSMFTGPDGHWLNRMFQDPWFVGQVRQRWTEVRASLLTLPDYLESEAAALAPAAGRNFSDLIGPGQDYLLPIGMTFLETDGIFYGSWAATVQHVDLWLTDRLAWMDDQLRVG